MRVTRHLFQGCGRLFSLALASAMVLAAPVTARAQPFCPESVIKLVVPFPPGGPVDSTARIVSEPLREALGQNVIVENRTGASGTVATAYVAQQPGNGCTILLSYDTHGVNPALFDSLPFDTVTAFRPVTLLGTIPNVLAVNPSNPWKTLDDVVAAARKSQDELVYGTGGSGTIAHLTMKRIEQVYGVRFRHVPYRGGAPALHDVLGGHVPMMMGSVLALGPSVREGKLNAVVQTGGQRHPKLPDVPTVAELGHPGFEVVSWIGVFLPASAPEAMALRLNAEFKRLLADKSTQDRLSGLGVQIVASSPGELQRFVENEVSRWTDLVKRFSIKPE